jgi:hypothetical protein
LLKIINRLNLGINWLIASNERKNTMPSIKSILISAVIAAGVLMAYNKVGVVKRVLGG